MNALGDNWVVAQLVAPQWSDDQKEQLVWPTRKVKWHGMKFATEDFIESVIADVSTKAKINPEHVYILAWSSGGPAAYAALAGCDKVKGAFIAMSVFKPDELPPLSGAKGKSVFVYHSPTDFINMSMPNDAVAKLGKAGAKMKLETYEGGHGWHGDIFGSIQKGCNWLLTGGQ